MISRDENRAKIFCIHEKWKRDRKTEIETGFCGSETEFCGIET
jgi:hypothetical protein